MPPRTRRLRFEDILEAAARIRAYTAGLSLDTFRSDAKTVDAVVRNLEVIGEAARHVDDPFVAAHPEVAWNQIRGFRNILAHEYFGVDVPILWQAVETDVPRLIDVVSLLLAQEPTDPDAD